MMWSMNLPYCICLSVNQVLYLELSEEIWHTITYSGVLQYAMKARFVVITIWVHKGMANSRSSFLLPWSFSLHRELMI